VRFDAGPQLVPKVSSVTTTGLGSLPPYGGSRETRAVFVLTSSRKRAMAGPERRSSSSPSRRKRGDAGGLFERVKQSSLKLDQVQDSGLWRWKRSRWSSSESWLAEQV